MSEEYAHLLVRDYTHWSLYVRETQNYLGRCVLWCKSKNALSLAEATSPELNEMGTICRQWEVAVQESFGAVWFNYAFLGNELPHLHGHLIPRYQKPVTFAGVEFVDYEFGHMYRTNHDFTVNSEVLEQIRSTIAQAL